MSAVGIIQSALYVVSMALWCLDIATREFQWSDSEIHG